MFAVLALSVALAACSDDDAADDGTTTTAPPEPIGSLSFGGSTYELTRSDCEVGGDGLSRWFAFDADGDVELAVYLGEVDSVSLLVRDGDDAGPSWEQTEDPSAIDADGDEAGVSGSATVVPVAVGEEEPADVDAVVEFDVSC